MTEERDPELDTLIRSEIDDLRTAANSLAKKAATLVALLDDAEVNHGGLWSGKTMRARDELRQELARWGKP